MNYKYIVTNKDGLLVRSQTSTLNPLNIKRKMSNGEGFTVYQTIVQNGNQTWGRVSDNPGGLQQEYVCLSIGNREFARLEAPTAPMPGTASLLEWAQAMDAWARFMGYEGPRPQ